MLDFDINTATRVVLKVAYASVAGEDQLGVMPSRPHLRQLSEWLADEVQLQIWRTRRVTLLAALA